MMYDIRVRDVQDLAHRRSAHWAARWWLARAQVARATADVVLRELWVASEQCCVVGGGGRGRKAVCERDWMLGLDACGRQDALGADVVEGDRRAQPADDESSL